MLRAETKTRARALQILYAWEVSGKPSLAGVVRRLMAADARCATTLEQAGLLAGDVIAQLDRLDAAIVEGVEHWRFERIGVVERNILRLALHELITGRVPPKVAIHEAVRLAHWFGGPKSAPFVNGVIDGMARRAGRL